MSKDTVVVVGFPVTRIWGQESKRDNVQPNWPEQFLNLGGGEIEPFLELDEGTEQFSNWMREIGLVDLCAETMTIKILLPFAKSGFWVQQIYWPYFCCNELFVVQNN